MPSTCSRLASVVIQIFQFIGLSYTVSIPTVIPLFKFDILYFRTISIPFTFLHHTIPCNNISCPILLSIPFFLFSRFDILARVGSRKLNLISQKKLVSCAKRIIYCGSTPKRQLTRLLTYSNKTTITIPFVSKCGI